MKYLNELSTWIKRIQQYTIWVIVIEVLCTVFISLGASQVDDFLSPWTLLIAFSAFIFIIVLLSRYSYLKYFPITLVENIKKDFEAKTLEQDYSRITLINNSIANSLISLNAQTCELQDEVDGVRYDNPVETKLCKKGIQQGLNSILADFLKNLHLITEASSSKFSVGVYLNNVCKLPDTGQVDSGVIYQNGTFLIKDDLQMKDNIDEGLFHLEGATGLTLEIQNCLKTCYNNNKSCLNPIDFNGKTLTIYCNVIPVVCSEDTQSGVLFLIGDKLDSIPNDLDDVTKIHNRVIANFVNKYNNCIIQKIQNKNIEQVMNTNNDTTEKK